MKVYFKSWMSMEEVVTMSRDASLHVKRDGRVYQMRDGFSGEPIPFKDAKHNYTRADIEGMKVGQGITFKPMYGNDNPVYSCLVRIK